MEQFHQITIDEWMSMKAKIQAELLGVKRSFVRIGYLLRKVEETEGYKNDGYNTIAEWAKGEYDMEASTVSRFMSINREFSVGGYSEQLLPEFEDFKRSQLEEMLRLPAPDRTMITPETPRADIRELKAFNKTEISGVADELEEFLEKFINDNMEMAIECEGSCWRTEETKGYIIPSGNKVYRKGIYILMANDQKVSIKRFGQDPQEFTWEQFAHMLERVFEELSDRDNEEWRNGRTNGTGPDGREFERDSETPDRSTGTDEVVNRIDNREDGRFEERDNVDQDGGNEQAVGDLEKKTEITEAAEAASAKEEDGKIAPAQNPAEIKAPEAFSQEPESIPEGHVEVENGIIMSRKEYLDTRSSFQAAEYLHKEMKNGDLTMEMFEVFGKLAKWLDELVDEDGNKCV